MMLSVLSHILFSCLILPFIDANSDLGGINEVQLTDLQGMMTIFVLGLMLCGLFDDPSKKKRGQGGGQRGTTIKRTRRRVKNLIYETGFYARRYYRLDPATFWKLHDILKESIELFAKREAAIAYQKIKRKRKRKRQNSSHGKKYGGGAPNGKISSCLRLSVAIRWFAGGDPLDIALVHGISHSEVYRSVWIVTDAVNNNSTFDIRYPSSHVEQKRIARDFKAKNKGGFDNCAGAIDGILIWINRPSITQCRKIGCGQKKFKCSRKGKFGLNMQATCDAHRRFLDVSIMHPGATSDYLSFVTSPLFHSLETPGFLSSGLALYGDNAYVSNRYMVTPFRSATSGPKDAFNYFQSSTRITIECAFGMLVHRWGILRKPFPMGVSLKKTSAVVMCLCKLHNFCIDNRETRVPTAMGLDIASISLAGGISTDDIMGNGDMRASALTTRGTNDRTDYNRGMRRREEAVESQPRNHLMAIVMEKGLERKKPRGWNQLFS